MTGPDEAKILTLMEETKDGEVIVKYEVVADDMPFQLIMILTCVELQKKHNLKLSMGLISEDDISDSAGSYTKYYEELEKKIHAVDAEFLAILSHTPRGKPILKYVYALGCDGDFRHCFYDLLHGIILAADYDMKVSIAIIKGHPKEEWWGKDHEVPDEARTDGTGM